MQLWRIRPTSIKCPADRLPHDNSQPNLALYCDFNPTFEQVRSSSPCLALSSSPTAAVYDCSITVTPQSGIFNDCRPRSGFVETWRVGFSRSGVDDARVASHIMDTQSRNSSQRPYDVLESFDSFDSEMLTGMKQGGRRILMRAKAISGHEFGFEARLARPLAVPCSTRSMTGSSQAHHRPRGAPLPAPRRA